MKFIIQYKNQYIKVKANEKYFHINRTKNAHLRIYK